MKRLILTIGIVTLVVPTLIAQTVTGEVTDSNSGEALPGVNIVVEGTTIGTTTNPEGEYKLDVPSLNDTLVYSFVGYQTMEMPINGRTTINVTMQLEAVAGEELVVVGYGSVEETDVTGSVSSVDVDELNQGVTSSVDQMMVGKSSGVNVVQNSGEPGGGFSINIRGSSSINASNGPLYVIDGVPVNKERAIGGSGVNLGNTQTPRNPLANLNTEDIESIEILKDASATAIYGSRGANGVVLITTKSGRSGDIQVNYHGSIGIQNWSNKLDLLNAQQYQRELNAIIDAGGEDPSFRVGDIANNGRGVDWQEVIENDNAPVTNQQISFSGGSENTTYFVSFNFMDQEGTVRETRFNRYSTRVNLESQVSDRLNLGLKATGTYIKDDFIPNGGAAIENSGVIRAAFNFDPTFPIRNDDGSFALNELVSVDNPMALLQGVNSASNTNRIFSTAFAEYDINQNLFAKLNIGGDFTNESRKTFVDDQTRLGRENNGIGSNQNSEMSHVLVEGTLNFNKTFGEHDINAVGGITYERFVTTYLYNSSSDFPSLQVGADNLGLGQTSNFELSNSKTANRLASYLGRVNYTLSEKYLLTLSARLDGSSRFGENNKFAFFPSGAIGWRLSEESFMEGISAINNLKIRVSWGQSGNQEIGDYPFAGTFSEGLTAVIGDAGVTTTTPSRLPNPDLKWETTEQLNFGLDFALWENRLEGGVDYYKKTTEDMLVNLPVPTSVGFDSRLSNVGQIENTGFELSLTSRNITAQEFQWTTNLNFSTLKNEVKSLGGVPEIQLGGVAFAGQAGIIRPGAPLNSFYGWEVEGIWQEGDDFSVTSDPVSPGSIKYRDQNGDGTITGEDRVILGNSFPDYQWSIGNTFNYKGFGLYVFLQAEQGFEILNANKVETFYPINFRRNKFAEPFLNRWTPENPSNKYPSFVNPLAQGRKSINSFVVEDGSYIKLRTVRLSYTLPKIFQSLRSAQIYVVGENLVTFTDYDGIDPAINPNGNANYRIDRNAFPTARTFMLGLKIGL
ncbi:SusC/RagA family TonB-linked outer membrane protein [Halalkalibaculum sp. DA3122]|uniref:SusC/RagA family TonB-linked outer membrane protein n=1 Tax=Halalkalibaculum sp. DA3122 TaxID=3373607 RepID=UPI003754B22F